MLTKSILGLGMGLIAVHALPRVPSAPRSAIQFELLPDPGGATCGDIQRAYIPDSSLAATMCAMVKCNPSFITSLFDGPNKPNDTVAKVNLHNFNSLEKTTETVHFYGAVDAATVPPDKAFAWWPSALQQALRQLPSQASIFSGSPSDSDSYKELQELTGHKAEYNPAIMDSWNEISANADHTPIVVCAQGYMWSPKYLTLGQCYAVLTTWIDDQGKHILRSWDQEQVFVWEDIKPDLAYYHHLVKWDAYKG